MVRVENIGQYLRLRFDSNKNYNFKVERILFTMLTTATHKCQKFDDKKKLNTPIDQREIPNIVGLFVFHTLHSFICILINLIMKNIVVSIFKINIRFILFLRKN